MNAVIFISRHSSHLRNAKGSIHWSWRIWLVMTVDHLRRHAHICIMMRSQNWMHIRRVRMLKSSYRSWIMMMMHHLINCIIILRVLLILLGFFVTCLTLILCVLLGIRMTSMAWYAHKVSAIIVVWVNVCKLLTWLILICGINGLVTNRLVVI